MTYATDGKCHNAEPGTFNHECGKPARWIGTTRKGWRSGFCDHCKQHGHEALDCVTWEPIAALPEGFTWDKVEAMRAKWGTAANMVPIACAPGVVAYP